MKTGQATWPGCGIPAEPQVQTPLGESTNQSLPAQGGNKASFLQEGMITGLCAGAAGTAGRAGRGLCLREAFPSHTESTHHNDRREGAFLQDTDPSLGP